MSRWTRNFLILLTLVALTTPAWAKKNTTDVRLDFRPQQEIGGAEADITRDMLERSVELRIHDSRPGDDASEIGTRTDDDDRLHTLRSTNDVGEYVSEVLGELAGEWGLKVEEGADLVLDVALVKFKIVETNQAVGATFNADVRLSTELQDSGGQELWSGTSPGDATRYGKKFSNENVNEVLSDALLEAFAELLSDGGLHDAWRADE